MLKLSDEKIGTAKAPYTYPKPYTYGMDKIELNPREEFLKKLQIVVGADGESADKSQQLIHQADNLGEHAAYHNNYLGYLTKCWADHCGARDYAGHHLVHVAV